MVGLPDMHIMMVVPQFPYPVLGGLEHQALKLSKALLARGITVSAISGKIYDEQPSMEMVDGVRVHRFAWRPADRNHFTRATVALGGALSKFLSQVDVVHVHQHSSFGMFAIWCARMYRKPVLAKLPNIGAFGIPGLASGFLGAARLAVLRSASGIVAMCDQSIDELRAIGYRADRILVAPNGVDCTAPELSDRKGVGDVRFVFIGRLSREKGVDTLLTAWRQVRQLHDGDPSLDIWGMGPLERGLRDMTRSLGITGSVKFRGFSTDVPGVLAAADALVLPSLAEGNSNVVLEAMVQGLPVIAARVGGIPMQVGSAGERLLVQPEDSQALCLNMVQLARDSRLRTEVGQAMRARALTHFDIRDIAAIYERAYRELMHRHQPNLAQFGILPDPNA